MKECPCKKDCPDRNAICHTKGNCPHGYSEWAEEHKKEVEKYHEEKLKHLPSATAAKDRRHFNWIKYGQGNAKK